MDFDNKNLDPHAAKLWTFEDQEDFTYKSLSGSIADIGDHDCKAQFPNQCSIVEDKDEASVKSRLKFDANNVLSAGFTTAEKKIDTLRQDGKYRSDS